ncbi:MAG: ABC transporter ATP-binding protein [Clostridia bacterium]|jgi:multidrug/hemolysin transport system ATP-binding protein|nr:ABC transporter ATP-binding protein [Clostridia bacterium]
MHAIEIEHLKKYYGEVKAVDDISFTVSHGEFFAFLGVNGAGKSTTISIICGLLKRDGGEVKIEDMDLDHRTDEVKTRLGVVFQSSALDQSLSVADNLKFRAALYGITGAAYKKRLAELTELLSLKEIMRRPVGKLSGGQRRKADIARALIHEPDILILDEPTTGLDPQTRKTVWEVIHKLRAERNMTVFLTTHYMEETADADRVVILDGGKILANATPLELKNRFTGDYISIYHASEEEVKKLGVPYERAGEAFRIEVKNTAEATALILKYPAVFQDYEITKGKMDDVFLNVTGKKIGDNV